MYLAAVVKWTGNAACCAPPYNSLFPPTMRTGGDDDDNDGGDDYDNDGNGDDNDDTDSTFHTILCSRQQWGLVVMMAMIMTMTMVMRMTMIMIMLTLPSKQFFVLPQQWVLFTRGEICLRVNKKCFSNIYLLSQPTWDPLKSGTSVSKCIFWPQSVDSKMIFLLCPPPNFSLFLNMLQRLPSLECYYLTYCEN